MFEVILSPGAADRPLAAKLKRCFERLESEPRTGGNIKRLKGEWSEYWRYRDADWRVVYRVDLSSLREHVVTIAHRREVYE